MNNLLKNKRIAILATDGFEEIELTEPKKALEREGAQVDIVSPNDTSIKAWDHDHWSNDYEVDVKLADADPSSYNGLMLPGGVMNPDMLRDNADAVAFTKSFFAEGKPVAAICHGPWTLIETGALNGREVTSYSSIKTDLINAGAKWIDKEVVVDQGLVTSRNPDDLPAFNKKMVEEFCEGVHADQKTV